MKDQIKKAAMILLLVAIALVFCACGMNTTKVDELIADTQSEAESTVTTAVKAEPETIEVTVEKAEPETTEATAEKAEPEKSTDSEKIRKEILPDNVISNNEKDVIQVTEDIQIQFFGDYWVIPMKSEEGSAWGYALTDDGLAKQMQDSEARMDLQVYITGGEFTEIGQGGFNDIKENPEPGISQVSSYGAYYTEGSAAWVTLRSEEEDKYDTYFVSLFIHGEDGVDYSISLERTGR